SFLDPVPIHRVNELETPKNRLRRRLVPCLLHRHRNGPTTRQERFRVLVVVDPFTPLEIHQLRASFAHQGEARGCRKRPCPIALSAREGTSPVNSIAAGRVIDAGGGW